ncbi:LppP/LprE family lipoprotein [Mycobacterium sp.]|uniref:LppP/LprE family lipoprotein n=3 Tax=Mycobacterium sp. TaxID=1785 RepID=UPI003C7830B6
MDHIALAMSREGVAAAGLIAAWICGAAGFTPPQGWPWGHEPQSILGNFDPCATLSVALITVEMGTRSSPEQALLFHDGNYVGTATQRRMASCR